MSSSSFFLDDLRKSTNRRQRRSQFMRHRGYEIRLHTIDFFFRCDISYKNYRTYSLLFRLKNVLMDAGCHRLAYSVVRKPDLGGKDLFCEISWSFLRPQPDRRRIGFLHFLPIISVSLRSNMYESAGLTCVMTPSVSVTRRPSAILSMTAVR